MDLQTLKQKLNISVSEVYLSQTRQRLDAEYYDPEYLISEAILNKKNSDVLGKLTKKIDVGFVGSMVSEYCDKGVMLLQTRNTKEFFIETNDCQKINEEFHIKLKKSQVHKEDILIARSGSFGTASVYLDDEVVNSSDIIIIQVKDGINPFYLTAFINSKYGNFQLLRFASGGLQGHINLTILEELKIAVPTKNIANRVQDLVVLAYDKKKASEKAYSEAESLLLKETNLDNYIESDENISVRNYKDCLSENRFDAEYWQPKYEEIETKIKNYKNGYKTLQDFITDYSTGYAYKSESFTDKGIPLIRINNITSGELNLSNATFLPDEHLYLSKKDIAKEGDILLSMSGTIGSTCKVPKGILACVNQRIMRITPKGYDPDVLVLILNSIICNEQLKRVGTGGVQTNISSNEIKKIKIPLLTKEKQMEIAKIIVNASKLKNESKELLEKAKYAVEIFIEQNEDIALTYLEKSLVN